ncbi:ABC transporter permease [Nocardiopsis synnemataformans]|uniref:ABC transporter permease n=1 Tax=Nocardiopsis synnemataformans TaxID=61305 RepID=UPI003EBD6AD7
MRVIPAWLGWRSVRHRPGSFLGAAVVLTIATALVSGLAFVYFSAERQVPTVERFDGIPLVAVPERPGGLGVPLETAERIADLPETAEVVPEVTFPASVVGPGTGALRVQGTEHSFGHGWGSASLTPFAMAEGWEPGPGDVVVDRRLAEAAALEVGQSVDLLVFGQVKEYRVSGIAETEVAWRYQSALFFEDAHAAELRGHGDAHADALGIRPADGVPVAEAREAVAELLPAPHTALSGAERGLAEGNIDPRADRATALSMNTFLLAVAVVATGVVAGAIGLSVRSRGREVAVLRAVAATPGQIRLMVAGEAAVLSLVALFVGLPLGGLLAEWLASGGLGLETGLSAAFQVHRPVTAVLSSAAMVLVSAQFAALLASRYALRVRPSDAFADAVTEGTRPSRWRTGGGAALLAAVFAGCLALPRVGPEGTPGEALAFALSLAAVIGAGMVAPGALGAASAGARALVRRLRPGSAGLATANVAFHHRRFAGAVSAFLMGTTMVGAFLGGQTYLNWLAGERAVAHFSSDLAVVAGDGDVFDTRALEEVRGTPGVLAATASYEVPVTLTARGSEPEDETVTVLDGDAAEVVDLGITEGGLDPGDGDAVAVLTYVAEAHGVGVGDRLTVIGPGGERELLVTGTYEGGYLNRSLAVGRTAAEHLGVAPGRYGEVHLTVDPSAGIGAVRDAVPLEGAVRDRDGIRASAVEEWAELNSPMTSMVVMVGSFLALGAANAVSITQFDRGREFAGMRVLGFGWPRVHGVVACEVVLTVGLLFVLAASVTFGVTASLGWGHGGPETLLAAFPGGRLLVLGAGTLVLSVAGAQLVVRAVSRNEDRDE